MTRRANRYFAKKVAGGTGLERPALHATAESPDGYHSAREPSDLDNDTEEELQDVESEEEPMVESDNSDTSSVQSGHASIRSQHSTTENRDPEENQREIKSHGLSPVHRMPRKALKAGPQMGRSPRWYCPCYETPRRKGPYSMLTGGPKWRSTSRNVTRTVRSKTQCCSPWRVRLTGISDTATNMVI